MALGADVTMDVGVPLDAVLRVIRFDAKTTGILSESGINLEVSIYLT